MTTPWTLVALREELSGKPRGTDNEAARRSESVVRQLFKSIVELDLEPGLVISERELMERTESSRTTLRQAVARLSDLGLVTVLPRKGVQIAGLDVLDVSAVYEARWVIELPVARYAAQRATADQIQALLELATANAAEAKSEISADRFIELDQGLHLAVAATARNRYLEDALTRILPQSARLWHRLYRELGPDRKLMFSHSDIVAAIRERDADAAEAAVREHLAAAREILAGVFLPSPCSDSP